MAKSMIERLKVGNTANLGHEEFIAWLVEDKFNTSEQRKLGRMTGRANFKLEQACIQNVRYEHKQCIKQRDILQFDGFS